MQRRDFLSSFTPLNKEKRIEIQSITNMDKKTSVLSRKEALHLLRRLGFGPKLEEINSLIGKTVDEAMEMLLFADKDVPTRPDKTWVDTPEENPLTTGSVDIRFEIEGRLKKGYREFLDWWLGLMANEEMPYAEKFTYFWSTVWTIEFTYDTLALIPPGLLLRNNETLRKNRFADYKVMARDITLDGSMLLYQSLFYSNRDTANENYMRELMELFTMGPNNLYSGEQNYTEGDIQEGSKILTGWRTAPYFGEPHPNGYLETYFSPADHIIESKTFMGDTIPARDEAANTEDLVKEEELGGLLNILFDRRKEAIAYFVANKIYRFFIYSNSHTIDKDSIKTLGDKILELNFDMKEFFKVLFSSEMFYAEENMGIQFKRPPELILGLQRMLGVEYNKNRVAISDLDQDLYDPPNVGSWLGYRTWISTSTYPLRVKYANEILDLATNQNLIDMAKKFDEFDNADKFLEAITEYFLGKSVSPDRIDYYKGIAEIELGASIDTWSTEINADSEKAANTIKALIRAFFTAPDFQLI